MGGVLIHLSAAIVCLLVVHIIHFKWEYSLAIFVGNFIPDIIKFGITSLKLGTVSASQVTKDFLYHNLDAVSSNIVNWFGLGFFVLGTGFLLWHFHVIKKKTMKEYDELYVFLLIGILIHLVIDVLWGSAQTFLI